MNGLYIHIPFCKNKCNYCDFASYPSLLNHVDEYINALCREMKLYSGEKINTIYFGGGTPSLLSTSSLGKIIDCASNVFDISPDSEITLEANPCTIDSKKAKDIYNLGINRISLGAQSFVDSELSLLGRLHKSADTIRAYSYFADAQIENISLDLMYALPGQTRNTLEFSLDEMMKLSPKHISCYGLKIEEGTPFEQMAKRREITEKTDDEYANMYEYIQSYLFSNGYNQYELSNFSLDSFESKHNLKYWTLCDYIGIGLSASSCYKGKRYTRTRDFKKYIENFENDEYGILSKEDMMSEYMILSLRLTKRGALKGEFESLFGKQIDSVFPDAISKHKKNGLLIDMNDRFVLSPKAYYVSNYVLCDFMYCVK